MPAADGKRILRAVQAHADLVLQWARGRWSERHPPLFADALDVDSLAPAMWRDPDGVERVPSNLANQQDFFRTLVGLSALTGDQRYEAAARAAVTHACTHLQDTSGLFFWGGHWTFDVLEGVPFGMGNFHELKMHYPWIEFLWELDRSATRRFIEAFWNHHILDWRNLDMNRHGEYGANRGETSPWSRPRELAPVFFVGRGLSFKNTGSDLFNAAARLARLTGEPGPLAWAETLAERYVATRDPRTGLSGYQYSQIAHDRAAQQFGPEFGDAAREHSILDRTRATRVYGTIAICQLALAETLGTAGERFLHWTVDDLKAFARHAYDAATNTLHPVLRDGRRLSPANVVRPGYYAAENFASYPAGGIFLWAYARAYRLSGDMMLRETVAAIARGLGFGDVFDGAVRIARNAASSESLLGILELYSATRRPELLRLAAEIGEWLLEHRRVGDHFVDSRRQRFARVGRADPLALLHLVAALRNEIGSVPQQTAAERYFTAHAWQKGRTSDYLEWFPQERLAGDSISAKR